MQKKYLILTICLILGLHALAQDNKKEFKSEWNVGIGGGPTFSSIDFDPSVPTKNISQFSGGVSVRYLSEKHLGLIAELNYSQQGWEGKFDKEYSEFKHKHKLNYIEVPLLTHIYFGNKVRFIINLGPKFSFLLSDSEEMSQALVDYLGAGNVPPNVHVGQYNRKANKKFDYGIIAGLGLEFRTGIGHFSLEGRYSFGFGDIYKNSRTDHFSRSANRVISAKLTYYIKLF